MEHAQLIKLSFLSAEGWARFGDDDDDAYMSVAQGQERSIRQKLRGEVIDAADELDMAAESYQFTSRSITQKAFEATPPTSPRWWAFVRKIPGPGDGYSLQWPHLALAMASMAWGWRGHGLTRR